MFDAIIVRQTKNNIYEPTPKTMPFEYNITLSQSPQRKVRMYKEITKIITNADKGPIPSNVQARGKDYVDLEDNNITGICCIYVVVRHCWDIGKWCNVLFPCYCLALVMYMVVRSWATSKGCSHRRYRC